ncbi:kinetochore-associated Ndc80 complex subunit spc25 [Kappamyces sp. JEL0829]|nr:kinetochore-associated Ndc80 complex subunit spc25 [Kappamyces sp. JEL0829]
MLAHQNPSSNPIIQNSTIGVKELTESCNSFLASFDTWIANRKASIDREWATFSLANVEFKTQKSKLESDLERKREEWQGLQSHTNQLMQTTLECKEKTKALKDQDQELQNQILALSSGNTALRREIQSRKQEKQSEQENKKKFQGPALKFFQEMFAMKVIPIEESLVRFVFTCIDEQAYDRPFQFEIYIRDSGFTVKRCEPRLAQLDTLVNQLNESKDLYEFLKQIRKAFVVHCKTE